MKSLIIVREDNRVIVDGVSRTVNCSSLPADFHALHWDGVTGEIEYSAVRCPHCAATSKKLNSVTTDIAPYQPYVNAWNVEDARVKAEEAARVKAEEAAKQQRAAAFAAAQEQEAANAAGPKS